MNRIFAILLSAGFLFINAAEAKLFNAEEFTLDNGLRVVVIENHKAPLIKHMIWYRAGAVDEQFGKGGSAHLLEHLMFRGSKRLKTANIIGLCMKTVQTAMLLPAMI